MQKKKHEDSKSEHTKSEQRFCPVCGGEIIPQSGCEICPVCGWSKCGL
jgi:hypothetical protein